MLNIFRRRSMTDMRSIDKFFKNTNVSGTELSGIHTKLCVWKGDITTLNADCIVNAANNSLLGGGGVDGAIHDAAGPLLLEECIPLNGCETGDAKLTKGYNLPAKFVIHTVGPIGEKPELLTSCYQRCLDLAKTNNLKTIAFPSISTGLYGYPKTPAAHVTLMAVREWLESSQSNMESIEQIIFCTFSNQDKKIYETVMNKLFATNE